MVQNANTASDVVSLLRTSLRRVSGSSWACTLSTFVLATGIAFSLTLLCGVPAPRVHDEFSYLLGADTLQAGRLTNPTHPMWQHFETFHVIQQPTYASKYPPAQAISLAVGQRLGHPIIGACLTTGLALAGLAWMLTAWLPHRLHGWIVVYAAFHPLIQIFWGQSYWGGGLALLGASLLLGAFIRLIQHLKTRYALIAAAGILLLANTRPMEGAVLTATIALALGWQWFQRADWKSVGFLARIVIPGGTVLAAGATLMLVYNSVVSGHPLRMPYQIHEQVYGWNPLFLWEASGAKPEYRHEVMERFFEADKLNTEARFSTLADLLRVKGQAAYRLFCLLCGSTAIISLFGLPWALRRARYRLALGLALPAFVASLVTPWAWPHYAAPAAPLLITLVFAGLLELWHRTRRQTGVRLAFLTIVVLMQLGAWTSTLNAYLDFQQTTWAKERRAIEQELLERSGRDLVLVRYGASHNPNAEWVYNAADIDNAEVVWAREISNKDRNQLIHHFHDRNVWIVEADETPPILRRFERKPHDYAPRIQLVTE